MPQTPKWKIYGSGNITRKWKQAVLSFMNATLSTDRRYDPSKYYSKCLNGCGAMLRKPMCDARPTARPLIFIKLISSFLFIQFYWYIFLNIALYLNNLYQKSVTIVSIFAQNRQYSAYRIFLKLVVNIELWSGLELCHIHPPNMTGEIVWVGGRQIPWKYTCFFLPPYRRQTKCN